jgi:F-box-like
VISIDTLPDEALLAIFDFCLGGHQDLEDIKTWQSLIHVCRRWRSIVFGSPRRLNLRIAGTPKTPVRDLLGVWPDLPIVIRDTYTIDPIEGLYNIIALLEHSHRVCKIHLGVPSSHFEEVSAAMEVPFPELTELELTSYDLVGRVPADPVLRDSFLGGSAPRLRRLALTNLLFPGLPKLLLSATHLVELFLFDLPLSEYISPEMLVIALSAMTNLRLLSLRLQSPQSRHDQAHRRLSPPTLPTRAVLPVLTFFGFQGFSEYLEDLLARIDAPLLGHFFVTYNPPLFNTTQFAQFIGRTPKLKEFKKACVWFGNQSARVDLSKKTDYGSLTVTASLRGLERQLLSLEQACITSLPPLSTSEDLDICEDLYWRPDGRDRSEITLWLGLLCPFIAVKNLYLSEEFAPRIIRALQESVVGGTTEVLPSLQNIFLEGLKPSGPIQEAIGQFVAARQVTSYPIAVSRWDRKPFLACDDRDKMVRYAISAAREEGIRQRVEDTREDNEQDRLDDIQLSAQHVI